MAITRVQYVSNASTGSGTTSLTTTIAAATAGNLLIALIVTGSTASNGTTTTPTGFTAVFAGPVTNTSANPPPVNIYLFYKVAAGGETSVVATNTVISGVTCQVWEFSATNGWPASPVDVFASSANQAATTTPVTGTTATTTQAEELWIAGVSTNGGTAITYSLPTNGFTQEATAWAGASAFFAPNTAALYKIVAATATASSGVTSSISKGFGGLIAAFKDNTGGSTVNGRAESDGVGTNVASGTTLQTPATFVGGGAQAASVTLAAPAQSAGQGQATAAATLFTAAQSAGQGTQSDSATLSTPATTQGQGSAPANARLLLTAESDGLAQSTAHAPLIWPFAATTQGTGQSTATLPSPTALPVPIVRSVLVAGNVVTGKSVTTSGVQARSIALATASVVTVRSITVTSAAAGSLITGKSVTVGAGSPTAKSVVTVG